MRFFAAMAFVAVLNFTATTARATQVVGVPSLNWVSAADNIVTISIAGTVTGTPPSCASAGANYYALDVSTASGSNMQRMLYAAALAGASVNLLGTGNCGAQKNIETIQWIKF